MKTKKKFKVIIQRKLLKFNLDKDNIFFILTLIVGVGAVFIAVSYAKNIDFLTHYLYPEHLISTQSIAIGAFMVFISGYITTRLESKTSGSGIPQTKIAYVAHHGVISFKMWSLKFISSVLALGSGMSLGREGPTVTTAAGFGSSLGSLFSLSKTQIKGLLAVGHHVIQDALQSKIFSLKTLSILFALKFVFTSLCYSTGISGGLFMPTLFLGAIIGSMVGVFAVEIHPGLNTIGAFAMVGMGAFFVSVIRAPFTSIIMIFEMTGEYKIILPLMIANITAFIISKKLMSGSIYEQIASQDGIHLPSKDDFDVLESLTVEDAMVKDVKTLNYDHTIRETMKAVNHSEISGYPVMKFGYISGVVSTNDLCQAYAKFQGECILDQISTKEIISIHPDQSLMVAFHLLKKHKVSRLLVTSRENERSLVGIITAEDIVNRFGFHLQEESKAELIDQYMEEHSPSSPI